MALADGYIAMSASKNHYSYWRPVTAIRAGETDGNPDTTGDPAWTPLRPTPPNQDYRLGSLHRRRSGAEVLKQFFGTDQISFQDCGVTLPAGSTCSDRVTSAPLVYELLSGGDRECVFAHPHRVPLPQIGRRRDRVRSKNWRACRHSLPPPCTLSYSQGLAGGQGCGGFGDGALYTSMGLRAPAATLLRLRCFR